MATPVPARVSWIVAQLPLRPHDHVLEIGCGNGVAAALVCARLAGGRLVAIDRSPAMIAAAQRRNRAHVESGTAEFVMSTLAGFDAPSQCFDLAFAINVNVFWQKPAAELEVLGHVLRPEGTLCLAFQPPAADQIDRIVRACQAQLREHGLAAGETRRTRFGNAHAMCIRASRSAAS